MLFEEIRNVFLFKNLPKKKKMQNLGNYNSTLLLSVSC